MRVRVSHPLLSCGVVVCYGGHTRWRRSGAGGASGNRRRSATPGAAAPDAGAGGATEKRPRLHEYEIRRGARQPVAALRRQFIRHEPRLHRYPAAGHRRADQLGLAASARRCADSAVNGDIHVRNEHANVQYRINGIILPDGISGFGHVLDTSFVGSARADHRRAAGAIRPAHRRHRRHPDQERQCAACQAAMSASMAAVSVR